MEERYTLTIGCLGRYVVKDTDRDLASGKVQLLQNRDGTFVSIKYDEHNILPAFGLDTSLETINGYVRLLRKAGFRFEQLCRMYVCNNVYFRRLIGHNRLHNPSLICVFNVPISAIDERHIWMGDLQPKREL